MSDTPTPGEEARRRTAVLGGMSDQLATFDEDVVANTSEVAMLRYEVQRERAARGLLAKTIAIMGLGLIALGYIVLQNRVTIRIQQHTQALFVECTTPGDPSAKHAVDRVHPCYDRSVANGRASIAIVQAQTTAAAIATSQCTLENVAHPEAIGDCVRRHLAENP